MVCCNYAKEEQSIPIVNEIQTIQNLIYEIRGQRVMLDRDLAELYGVETRRLNEQVKRNIERFPEDFMFQLTKGEFEILKSQIATSNSIKMGLRKLPYAFTENGVAMLSSVLRSPLVVKKQRENSQIYPHTINKLKKLTFFCLVVRKTAERGGVEDF